MKGIRDDDARAVADALKVNATVQSVNLGCMHRFYSFEMRWISECGENATAIERQHMVFCRTPLALFSGAVNRIGDDGACALAGVVRVNRTLRQIRLKGALRESHFSCWRNSLALLHCALVSNNRLAMHYSQGNYVSSKGVFALVESLAHNKTLLELELGGE